MRLILQDCLRSELSARQKYFYETFHLWFVIKSINNHSIQLVSIPTNCTKILFIVGHNTFVKDYLTCTKFEEEKIAAITCDGTIHFSNLKLPNKTIYISHQNDHNYADLLNGALYEFDFDPTESEILLYNTNKLLSPLQRIEKSFRKL